MNKIEEKEDPTEESLVMWSDNSQIENSHSVQDKMKVLRERHK